MMEIYFYSEPLIHHCQITTQLAAKKKVENTNNINCRFNSDFLPIDTPKHR